MRSVLFFCCLYLSAAFSVVQLAKFITSFAIFTDLNPEYFFTRDQYIGAFGLIGTLGAFFIPALTKRVSSKDLFTAGLGLGIIAAGLLLLPLGGAMLAARCLEGLAHLLLIVSGPALIKQSVPESGLRPAMSVWGTFFSAGFILDGLISTWFTPAVSAFIAVLGYALAYAPMLIIFVIFFRSGVGADTHPDARASEETPGGRSAVYPISLLAFVFFIYAALNVGWISYPSMLSDRDVSVSSLGTAAMIGNLAGLIPGIIAWQKIRLMHYAAVVFATLAGLACFAPMDFALIKFFLLGTLPVLIYGSFSQVLRTPSEFILAGSALIFTGNLATMLGPQIFGLQIFSDNNGWFGVVAVTVLALSAILSTRTFSQTPRQL